MPEPTHLARAPISEAIVDFRAKLPKAFEARSLDKLRAPLVATYPRWEPRRILRAGFELVEGRRASQSTEEALYGFLVRSKDGRNVAQIRIDGLTLSQLPPYGRWEHFFSEAQRLWCLYDSVVKPEFVTRIAVSYVNHLKLPLPMRDFSQYLCAPPSIPSGLPPALSSFLTRVVIHDQSQLAASITQALDKSVSPEFVTVILDIDAYREGTFRDNTEMFAILEKLREFKNRIFFSSITAEALELFR